jgi:molecular chaperone GrpE
MIDRDHRPRGKARDEESVLSDEPERDAEGEVAESGDPIKPASPPAGEDDGTAGSGLPAEDVDQGPAFKDRWLRAEAELQNYRRRAARDREESRRAAEESVLLDVISILDDLDRAIASARDAAADSAWLKGVELVADRLKDVLRRRGVEEIDPSGKPFDPELQEALLEVDATGDVAPGTVVQVVLKGYRREGRALRPARVVVARGRGKDA